MEKYKWSIDTTVSLLLLICVGCSASREDYGEYYQGRLYAKTPIGRLSVTGIFSMDFVKEGAERAHELEAKLDNMKLVPSIHPDVVVPEDPDEYYRLQNLMMSQGFTFPNRKQLHQIENLYRSGDLLAYCGGPDKGWFIIRDGKIIAVWVTDHSF